MINVFHYRLRRIPARHILITKETHSINLLAISDAKYRFIVVDIGGEGRQSDGVFRNSLIENYIKSGSLKLPSPKPIEINGLALPYVLLKQMKLFH